MKTMLTVSLRQHARELQHAVRHITEMKTTNVDAVEDVHSMLARGYLHDAAATLSFCIELSDHCTAKTQLVRRIGLNRLLKIERVTTGATLP